MKSFRASITLEIDDFESLSHEDADELLNSYIDSLARISDNRLTWFSLDYDIEELTNYQVFYKFTEKHPEKVDTYDEAKALVEKLTNEGFEGVYIGSE